MQTNRRKIKKAIKTEDNSPPPKKREGRGGGEGGYAFYLFRFVSVDRFASSYA